MAFEQQNTTTTTTTRTRRPFLDSGAFLGILIGLLILAAVAFFFRSQIAAKIASWRSGGREVARVQPVLPTVTPVKPASSTPTPTPTSTATPSPTPRAVAGTVHEDAGNLPQSGPGETGLVVACAAALLGIPGLRTTYYRRKLRARAAKLDIL